MKKIFIIILIFFSDLNAKWSANSCDTYATHQPVLYEIANITSGPIIEFGCGDGSTDLLHEICKKNNRLLVTIDDDFNWINKFAQKYLGDGYKNDNSGWHKFFFIPGKINDIDPTHWIKFLDNFDLLKILDFDLCFVDQSPWLARTETILRLKDKVKYIILHDCDGYAAEPLGKQIMALNSKTNTPGIYDFNDSFKYFKVYFPPKPWPGHTGPPTLLGSNFESYIPDIDYNLY